MYEGEPNGYTQLQCNSDDTRAGQGCLFLVNECLMGSQLNTLPPHNDNYLSRMCGVVLDKYVWRSDLEKGKVVPPNTNTNTNTNMCEEVMWKKGRGAAKYKSKYKYV